MKNGMKKIFKILNLIKLFEIDHRFYIYHFFGIIIIMMF